MASAALLANLVAAHQHQHRSSSMGVVATASQSQSQSQQIQSQPCSAAPGKVKSKVCLHQLADSCKRVLRDNDEGGYTIPSKGLYPYQWNWDSALVAMGLAEFDCDRGWTELQRLLSAQWKDGMVPHIVFHKPTSSYFPGPDVWGCGATTGITQPPVAAIAARRLLERDGGGRSSRARAAAVFPKIMAWHEWFYAARDPLGTGLVATLHPWETGMDNSPAWDEPLAAVPVDSASLPAYVRRDTGHVDPEMRPTRREYDKYLSLLYGFRAAGYDPRRLFFESPFRVTDLCTNAVLQRANVDLRWLAAELGAGEATVQKLEGWIARGTRAMDALFDTAAGMYRSMDQKTGRLLPALTSAGFLPLFAGAASPAQAGAAAATLEKWLSAPSVRYAVPSCDPRDEERFEARRYWRGPVWLVVNWMIAEGMGSYSYNELSRRIQADSLDLVSGSGMFEYFSPITGEGAGGSCFSWTAALCLSWLLGAEQPTSAAA